MEKLLPCTVKSVKQIADAGCDVVCIIDKQAPADLVEQFNEFRSFDKGFDGNISCFKSTKLNLPIVYSPIPDFGDYHDVRAYKDAAAKALARAAKGGFKSPLLVVPENSPFSNAELCTVIGALDELYVPLQLRECVPEKKQRVTNLLVLISSSNADDIYKDACILSSGLFVARDIGASDPERMPPPKVEEYVKGIYPSLITSVISDVGTFEKEYPLFAAVNRAANTVKRHQGRIIYLEYKPSGTPKRTLMLVGKGVCYDTGGADLKVGGIMVGMSRDKCGAAVVAGFMQIVQEQKPADVHVIAALCLVRNSVGEDCYVPDEIVTSRAGIRARIGNTDAEGRMAMADALCRMKEMAKDQNLPDPQLITIATLTGHACLSVGVGYSIVIDNSVADKAGVAKRLQEIGTAFGEPLEISKLRLDDFEFNSGKVIGEDVVQCNNAGSARTPRGHQIPVAFMMVAAGLDKHGLKSEKPLKYTHFDIASSACMYPRLPSGTPVVALAKTFL